MSTKLVIVDGNEYEVAPIEPELHDRPSPAFPVAITPEVARSWLGFNYRNRNQRKGAKQDYSTDMREQRYDVNGTTITFSRPLEAGEDERVPAGRPTLIDGQHRLESCILADVPFVAYVAYGLNPEVRRTVDTGVKRQLADVFAMNGEKNASILASAVVRAHAWTNGDHHMGLRATMTHSQGEDFLAEHGELRRSSEIAARTGAHFRLTTGHDLRKSVSALAHWLFMQADQTKAPEFFARLGDGAEIPFEHPISLLRRRLLKDKNEKKQNRGDTRRDIPNVPDWQVLCYFIRTWNEYVKGPNLDGTYRTSYALVGSKDAEKIPAIWTAKDVERWEAKRLADAEAQDKRAA